MLQRNNFLDSLAWWICAILSAVLPFHAFLFTWFHSFFWQQDFVIIIQAWKEILVGFLGILAVGKFWQKRKLPAKKSFWISGIFVILAILYAIFGDGVWGQKILGLRTATLFLGIFLAVKFFDFGKLGIERLKKIILLSAGGVILFALAQKFLLPPDFLVNFGYSANVSSWLPGGNLPAYHLVGVSETIRLQSTFAGPNQLAAFLLVILPLAIFEFWRNRKNKSWWKYFLAAEILGGFFVVIFTFSRSAWLGAVGIFLIFAVEMWRKNLSRKIKQRIFFGGITAILGGGILIFSGENLGEIFWRTASTGEHFERTQAAAELVLENPLGLGLGQTAGVSQRFGEGITPENTYLGIALELGWLGGILFLIFCVQLLWELKKANSPLFFSLSGILIIALFLHPLEDAPTTLTLFLLAGMINSLK
ncbi:O-antigen ligase family protein [Candidatus Gracilibacteria bacterium]|nr:O-antigen ligase family protein [Candidatus Gracilibacteria bacterium]MCF7896798.1 O-antigen ligase family protein [Candidatus Gracilibacteria bacterium]